jgi:PIN domain nuclease of toxin-antitoxin system
VILLLDAHTVIWWLSDDPTLSAEAREAIASPSNDVLVSAATIWEIEIKRAAGRLDSPDDLLDRVDRAGFAAIPIQAGDASRAARLPAHHGDPFDRMLVAQATQLDAVVVSRDAALDAYGVRRLPA